MPLSIIAAPVSKPIFDGSLTNRCAGMLRTSLYEPCGPPA
jgi:hypothetical protein